MSGLALKKVLGGVGSDLEHYLSVFATDLLLTQKLSYTAGGLTEYIGYALPGTATSQQRWLIKKLTYDGSNRVTDIQFASGEIAFNKIWDSRATYTYS